MFYDDTVMGATDLSVRAFTSDKVSRLTGLTRRRLQYWDERGFISPNLSKSVEGRGHRRLYDFKDLVSLRVATQLRSEGVSLQEIRRTVGHLRGLDYQHPLAEIRFEQVKGRLYFQEAGTIRSGRRPEQVIATFAIPFRAIVHRLEQDIAKLDRRPFGRIERRRGVLGSKPVIAGTRIPVASIQRLSSAGASVTRIRQLYPDLTGKDIRAALAAEVAVRPRKRAS
jgi:DNA-binding transcriptional MerR regulator